MFGFFKRKRQQPAVPPTTPAAGAAGGLPVLPGNPGVGVSGNVAFANGDRTWDEQFDCVRQLAEVLQTLGHRVDALERYLVLPGAGLRLLPQVAAFQPSDDGSRVQTTTTIQFDHPTLVPAGAFEYQHSWGPTLVESLNAGFDQWAQTDLVSLLDALRPSPDKCTTIEMEFPGRAGQVRRAVLGPVAHFAEEPRPAACPPGDGGEEGEHDFCPCCLLTRSMEAFKDLLERDGFYALRLFAARQPDGTPQADCRVNGEDYELGAVALRAYADSWDPAGYEFRKQYVVLQTVQKQPTPRSEFRTH